MTGDDRTDLVIVGAQKSATTTLFDMLAQSPRIAAARPKEPHFFSTVDDWRSRLDEYHRIYRGQTGFLRLEASTSYTFFPHRRPQIWNDLKEYNPDIRVIYIIRKPTDRILSHYRHSLRRGYTTKGLHEFVAEYPLATAICRYHSQIEPYLQTLGGDNVLILTFEEVVSRQAGTLARIAQFASLPQASLEEAGHIHANRSENLGHYRLMRLGALGRAIDTLTTRRRAARAAATIMPPDLASRIIAQLEPEIAGMERLMQRSFENWRIP